MASRDACAAYSQQTAFCAHNRHVVERGGYLVCEMCDSGADDGATDDCAPGNGDGRSAATCNISTATPPSFTSDVNGDGDLTAAIRPVTASPVCAALRGRRDRLRGRRPVPPSRPSAHRDQPRLRA